MPLTEEEVDDIITYQILANTCSTEKICLRWATYMEDNLTFPFEAEYLVRRFEGKDEWKKVGIIDIHTDPIYYIGGDYYLSAILEEVDMIIPVDINIVEMLIT